MAGRIVTARHGRPALPRDQKMSAGDYGRWWALYEETGLYPDERPSSELAEIARTSDIVLSSTRPRAIETARRAVGDDREIPADPLFVEMPLPAPPTPFLRLTPATWGAVSRTFWFLGYSGGQESHWAAWRRADEAADRLIETAESGDVLLCAHGYFNWMVDRVIRKRGWRRTHNGGNHYWTWRTYEPAQGRTLARPDERPSAAAE